MFYECEDSDIENYAGDTTPYACASDINTVIPELQRTASKLYIVWQQSYENQHWKKPPFLSS